MKKKKAVIMGEVSESGVDTVVTDGRLVEVYIAADVDFKMARIESEVERLREQLQKVANIAHHGALLGYKTSYDALNKIRKVSLPYWDKEAATALQRAAQSPESK